MAFSACGAAAPGREAVVLSCGSHRRLCRSISGCSARLPWRSSRGSSASTGGRGRRVVQVSNNAHGHNVNLSAVAPEAPAASVPPSSYREERQQFEREHYEREQREQREPRTRSYRSLEADRDRERRERSSSPISRRSLRDRQQKRENWDHMLEQQQHEQEQGLQSRNTASHTSFFDQSTDLIEHAYNDSDRHDRAATSSFFDQSVAEPQQETGHSSFWGDRQPQQEQQAGYSSFWGDQQPQQEQEAGYSSFWDEQRHATEEPTHQQKGYSSFWDEQHNGAQEQQQEQKSYSSFWDEQRNGAGEQQQHEQKGYSSFWDNQDSGTQEHDQQKGYSSFWDQQSNVAEPEQQQSQKGYSSFWDEPQQQQQQQQQEKSYSSFWDEPQQEQPRVSSSFWDAPSSSETVEPEAKGFSSFWDEQSSSSNMSSTTSFFGGGGTELQAHNGKDSSNPDLQYLEELERQKQIQYDYQRHADLDAQRAEERRAQLLEQEQEYLREQRAALEEEREREVQRQLEEEEARKREEERERELAERRAAAEAKYARQLARHERLLAARAIEERYGRVATYLMQAVLNAPADHTARSQALVDAVAARPEESLDLQFLEFLVVRAERDGDERAEWLGDSLVRLLVSTENFLHPAHHEALAELDAASPGSDSGSSASAPIITPHMSAANLVRAKLHPDALKVDETQARELAKAIRGMRRTAAHSMMGHGVPLAASHARNDDQRHRHHNVHSSNDSTDATHGRLSDQSSAEPVFMSGRLPEDRILDFVCNAEPAQWLKALQHAFTPPPSDEHALQSHIPEVDEHEEDQLWTTPVRLVHVIDERLKEQQQQGGGALGAHVNSTSSAECGDASHLADGMRNPNRKLRACMQHRRSGAR